MVEKTGKQQSRTKELEALMQEGDVRKIATAVKQARLTDRQSKLLTPKARDLLDSLTDQGRFSEAAELVILFDTKKFNIRGAAEQKARKDVNILLRSKQLERAYEEMLAFEIKRDKLKVRSVKRAAHEIGRLFSEEDDKGLGIALNTAGALELEWKEVLRELRRSKASEETVTMLATMLRKDSQN
jgi:RNA polymerase-interacting CarD/CdnL/TRCF family regulator